MSIVADCDAVHTSEMLFKIWMILENFKCFFGLFGQIAVKMWEMSLLWRAKYNCIVEAQVNLLSLWLLFSICFFSKEKEHCYNQKESEGEGETVSGDLYWLGLMPSDGCWICI